MNPFWNSHQVPHGTTLHWELGPLDLWVRHLPGEWQIFHENGTDPALDDRWTLAVPGEMPAGAAFQRYAVDKAKDPDLLTLRPRFPNRSVVSKPSSLIVIPAGTHARFYCGIPLSVRLQTESGESPLHLTTVPVIDLSRTWFGSPMEGEACFATRTEAIRDYRDLPPHGIRALCPVRIRNRSSDPLPFERICIRVRHLSLYQGSGYLWSNPCTVTKGTSQNSSEVTFARHAPGEEKDAVLVEPPVEDPSPHGVILRSFGNLRHLAGFQ